MSDQNYPCDHPSCIKSSLLGLRQGIYYGAKVRFFHALVMIMLFREGSMREKFKTILKLTKDHSLNLGMYVFLYKSIVCILNKIKNNNSQIHSFISGALSGYIVFGREKTPVNQQIVLYLLSRIIVGASQNLQNKGIFSKDISAFPWLTALCWGTVMFLFENDHKSLQASLTSSMNFLYKDSDKIVHSWKQLVPFNLDMFQ